MATYDAVRLLVRPDGYVAFADSDGTDDKGVLGELKTWFGGAPAAAPASVSAA